MSDQMAALTTTTSVLTAMVDDIINNRNNHNRGGEPIKVHDGNNRINWDLCSIEETDDNNRPRSTDDATYENVKMDSTHVRKNIGLWKGDTDELKP